MTTYRAGSRLERIGLVLVGVVIAGLASPFAITAYRVAHARFIASVLAALGAWVLLLFGLYLVGCAMRDRLPAWYTEFIRSR
ncbi:MAG TPA: hypothetical protein VJ992_16055 [Gemmatimonadales bacterium]|nr:hypothetical protein [Gemmatimonadales bacterium]